MCEKCHSEGLAREEADEVDGDGDVTRHNSASSSTVPLPDQDLGEVATPPVSPVKPKKQPRGRRPTNDILKKTTILTRSRSSRMGLRVLCQRPDRVVCQRLDRVLCQRLDRVVCQRLDRVVCQRLDRVLCQRLDRVLSQKARQSTLSTRLSILGSVLLMKKGERDLTET